MNTIPLIFNERQFKRTILGGSIKPSTSKIPLTVVLLNRRGSQFRTQQLETLIADGYESIICVENSSDSYILEEYSQKFPFVKFIVPLEKITFGEMINAGIAEAQTEYVLVIWDDLQIKNNMVTFSNLKKITEKDNLCVAPYLESKKHIYLPVRMVPAVQKYNLTVYPETITNNLVNTVYPFDGIGLYNRKKFMQLGGFDYTLINPYWQLLDFSLRGWLWGEKFIISSNMKFIYDDIIPSEDITADYMQLRFYLKNTAPIFNKDHAYIPISLVFSYIHQSSTNIFKAIFDFKDARKWVEKNKYRFKMDMTNLVKNWESNRS